MPHLLLFPSQLLFCLVIQRYVFPVWERVRCVIRPNNGCKRDYAYCRSSNGEKIKIIPLQLVAGIGVIWLHTLMRQSDWCKQHTTLHSNKDFFFFSFKKTQKRKASISFIMDKAKKVNNFIFTWISLPMNQFFRRHNFSLTQSEIPWLFLGLEVIRLSQAFPDLWQPYLQ